MQKSKSAKKNSQVNAITVFARIQKIAPQGQKR